jgi:malate dehydrogenase (oxaloacetate-decarboxylating)
MPSTKLAQYTTATNKVLHVKQIGQDLLRNPLLNKGSAFSERERDAFALHGLLPNRVFTLDEQTSRAYLQFQDKKDDLEKNIFLTQLHDNNETLFFRLVTNHAEEMVPIIYTPVEAAAIESFSHGFRRPRGLFLSYPDKDRIKDIIANYPEDDVEAIVVTDSEAILGIGDQGVGGIGITVGKLAIYTVCAGIYPGKTLPIVLDVGTNNQQMLNDPLYMGWRHERLRGTEYDAFVDTFVQAVAKRWPKVCLQWEDFGRANARRLLDKYRQHLLTFNDDIQGTGAVALAAIIAAVKLAGTKLSEQRVVVYGAGSGGTGVADQICSAMINAGLTEAQAKSRIYLIDVQGLLHTGLSNLPEFQKKFIQPEETVKGWSSSHGKITLADTVKNAKPTILIGTSTQPKAFTEEIVREMCRHTERPIIFPLSNPTRLHEAIPEDLIRWTDGKALVTTGSPFAPVHYKNRTITIGECNNCLIFPGLALGAIAAEAKHISDEMIHAASYALSECAPALKDPDDGLVPSISDAREVSRKVAFAVATLAQKDGLARKTSADELQQKIADKMWTPAYSEYKKD